MSARPDFPYDDAWHAAVRGLPPGDAQPDRARWGANASRPAQPERNRLILALLIAGRSYGQIAVQLDTTRGVVAGVRWRARRTGAGS